jgi:hypothetical protein
MMFSVASLLAVLHICIHLHVGNKMTVNCGVTRDLVVHRPYPGISVLPAFSYVDLVLDAAFVGVALPHSSSFDKHVDQVLASCSKRIHLMKTLQTCCVLISELSMIFSSSMVSQIIRCLYICGSSVHVQRVGRNDALLSALGVMVLLAFIMIPVMIF